MSERFVVRQTTVTGIVRPKTGETYTPSDTVGQEHAHLLRNLMCVSSMLKCKRAEILVCIVAFFNFEVTWIKLNDFRIYGFRSRILRCTPAKVRHHCPKRHSCEGECSSHRAGSRGMIRSRSDRQPAAQYSTWHISRGTWCSILRMFVTTVLSDIHAKESVRRIVLALVEWSDDDVIANRRRSIRHDTYREAYVARWYHIYLTPDSATVQRRRSQAATNGVSHATNFPTCSVSLFVLRPCANAST